MASKSRKKSTAEQQPARTRQDLEEQAGRVAQILSLTKEMATKDGTKPDFEVEDLFNLGYELRGLPRDHDRLYASCPAEVDNWNGERRVPIVCSRQQVLAAAGVAAQIYDSACSLSNDYCLNLYGKRQGSLGEMIWSLQDSALELVVELGRVLRQPGDVLEVGSEELSDAEIESRVQKRDRERIDRESAEKAMRQRLQDTMDSISHAWIAPRGNEKPDAHLVAALRDELQAQIAGLEDIETPEGRENGLRVVE